MGSGDNSCNIRIFAVTTRLASCLRCLTLLSAGLFLLPFLLPLHRMAAFCEGFRHTPPYHSPRLNLTANAFLQQKNFSLYPTPPVSHLAHCRSIPISLGIQVDGQNPWPLPRLTPKSAFAIRRADLAAQPGVISLELFDLQPVIIHKEVTGWPLTA